MIARKSNAEYLRELRYDAAARGLCYVCRCRFPRPGVRCCDECIERVRAAKRTENGLAGQRRRSRSKSKRKIAARKASGLCIRCGRVPAIAGYASCSVCLDMVASRALQRYRAAGRRPARCSTCGRLGHSRRRHERPGMLP